MIVLRYTNRPQPRRAGVHFTGTGGCQDQSKKYSWVQKRDVLSSCTSSLFLVLLNPCCWPFPTEKKISIASKMTSDMNIATIKSMMMTMMMLMSRRSDPVQINTVHGGSLQTQHQAHHPPICLQVKIQLLILDSRISMNFEIKHGFHDLSLLYEHQDILICLISQHCRTHTHALGRVVSGWKVTKKKSP